VCCILAVEAVVLGVLEELWLSTDVGVGVLCVELSFDSAIELIFLNRFVHFYETISF
jgi:hypothetical protein